MEDAHPTEAQIKRVRYPPTHINEKHYLSFFHFIDPNILICGLNHKEYKGKTISKVQYYLRAKSSRSIQNSQDISKTWS